MIAIIECDGCQSDGITAALAKIGGRTRAADAAMALAGAHAIVLPASRSFRRTLADLRERSLIAPILAAAASGVPILGIGSGMHLLFDYSEEDGRHCGLGLLHGTVARIEFGDHPAARHFSLPHMGWNRLRHVLPHPMLQDLSADEFFYFDHSCAGRPLDPQTTIATVTHGVKFAAAVARGHVWGLQFLPERSQAAGQTLLKSFMKLVEQRAGARTRTETTRTSAVETTAPA